MGRVENINTPIQRGYATCRFNHETETRIWDCGNGEIYTLPNVSVPMTLIEGYPFYVARIEDVRRAANG